MTKKIFVSSRLRGNNEAEFLFNRDQAERYCGWVVNHGHRPFAPHVFYTRFMNDDIKEHRDLAIEFCIEHVKESDEVWVFTINRVISEGMRAEIDAALKSDIPVRYFNNFMGAYTEYIFEKD